MERALARSRDRFSDPRTSRRRIRLMIVDDSTVARAVLSRMVEADPTFEITAVAGTAEDAIEALAECRVDIVVLDLEMPGAGGLKSIPRIISAAAGAKVMIVSSLAEDGAEQTVAALALGAADTLPKLKQHLAMSESGTHAAATDKGTTGQSSAAEQKKSSTQQ